MTNKQHTPQALADELERLSKVLVRAHFRASPQLGRKAESRHATVSSDGEEFLTLSASNDPDYASKAANLLALLLNELPDILTALRANAEPVAWQPIETAPMWDELIVADPENNLIAFAAKCEGVGDETYWGVEPEDGLGWEPKVWIRPLYAGRPPEVGEGELAKRIGEALALFEELLDGPSNGDFYGVSQGQGIRNKLETIRLALKQATPSPAPAEGLAEAVEKLRVACRNEGVRAVARATGVSKATISRFVNGKETHVSTLLKVAGHIGAAVQAQAPDAIRAAGGRVGKLTHSWIDGESTVTIVFDDFQAALELFATLGER